MIVTLFRVGHDAAFVQIGDRVADRAAVNAEIAAVGELPQDCLGQCANPALEYRGVFDQRRRVARDLHLRVVRRSARHFERRAIRMYEHVEIGRRQHRRAVRARRGSVDLGDHDARAAHERHQIFMCNRHAVTSATVDRRDLQEQHIDPVRPLGERARELRVMDRQHVEHAGFRKPAVAAGPDICDEVNRIRMFGGERIGNSMSNRALP